MCSTAHVLFGKADDETCATDRLKRRSIHQRSNSSNRQLVPRFVPCLAYSPGSIVPRSLLIVIGDPLFAAENDTLLDQCPFSHKNSEGGPQPSDILSGCVLRSSGAYTSPKFLLCCLQVPVLKRQLALQDAYHLRLCVDRHSIHICRSTGQSAMSKNSCQSCCWAHCSTVLGNPRLQ